MRRSWPRPLPFLWPRKNRGRSRFTTTFSSMKLKVKTFPSRPPAASQSQHLPNQTIKQSRLLPMTTRMPTLMQTSLPTSPPLPSPLPIQILPPLQLLLRMVAQTPTNKLLGPKARHGLWDQTQLSERDRTLIFCCELNLPI